MCSRFPFEIFGREEPLNLLTMAEEATDSGTMELFFGFRVIIMTVANSLRKSMVPDALPMFGTREYMSLSIL